MVGPTVRTWGCHNKTGDYAGGNVAKSSLRLNHAEEKKEKKSVLSKWAGRSESRGILFCKPARETLTAGRRPTLDGNQKGW